MRICNLVLRVLFASSCLSQPPPSCVFPFCFFLSHSDDFPAMFPQVPRSFDQTSVDALVPFFFFFSLLDAFCVLEAPLSIRFRPQR